MMTPLLLILYLALPVFLFLYFFQNHRTLKNQALPPGPRGLPIIGNLLKLDNSALHLQLWQLSKKYGPLFYLRLGLRPVIVIASSKVAKEALKNQDLVFSGRPKYIGQQKLSYNGAEMAFSPYNACWREIRKFAVSHFLSTTCVSSFSSIREFEVKQMIQKISSHASSSKVINLPETVISLTVTIVCRLVLGKRYEDEGPERRRFLTLFNECNALLGTFFISDYIPFLSWIDRLMGRHARLNKNFNELDQFYQEVIDEHMDPNRKTPEGEDIAGILLQLKKQNAFSVDLTYDHIKALLMDLLVGATDTTAATTIWTMTALIKHPTVMKKLQEEIWSIGGKKDFLDEEDIQKFTYLKAVIKETLRLYLPSPLLLRETTENCIIDGYKIPAKTLAYVNVWAIHMDPEVWKDPEEFYPERFLDNDINYRGQDLNLIPFGTGRRICPGMSLGVATLEVILANLLNSFNWELPAGVTKEDIDTERLPGIAQNKKNPLYLIPKCHV